MNENERNGMKGMKGMKNGKEARMKKPCHTKGYDRVY